MNLPLLHGGSVTIAEASVGSPLYDIAPEHVGAIVAVLLMPVAAWYVRLGASRGSRRAQTLLAGYDRLPTADRIAAWLIAVSAVVHLALIGHGPAPTKALFLADAIALAWVARRLVLGRPWRLPAVVVLTGSVAAWWAAAIGGEPPDQVAIATKLVEIVAITLAIAPRTPGRLKGLASTSATVALVFVTALAGWIGSFAAAAEGAEPGQGHHGGAAVAPGTLLTAHPGRDATPEERAAADQLVADTRRAIAKYANPAVAAADGYDVAGLAGLGFHAGNPLYEHDGRILDPERPETLVYADTREGPVLLGAMFIMPKAHLPGPAVGGPLTPWHAHEQICIGLLPPSLTGLVSPLGGCPVASIAVPLTPEMIHVWTVPGAPQVFGDLDEAWLKEYLATARG
jgi:hypothetical protein